MGESVITFIVNGNTYSLCSTDLEKIRNIPANDRAQLITFLEVIKRQDRLQHEAVQHAVTGGQSHPVASSPTPKPERLGSGDVDALMARLVAEEKNDRKPGLTQLSVYKFMLGFAVFVALLVFIF